jgi:hypothetical protein
VAVDGDTMAVGAPGAQIAGSTGKVVVYDRAVEGAWIESASLVLRTADVIFTSGFEISP